MSLAFLEDFNSKTSPEAKPAAVPVEEQPGYAEGFAAGMAQVQSEQAMLSAQVVDSISDLTFGFAEAQTLILGRLAPLFEALSETVLPQLARDGMGLHLIEALTGVAQTAAGAPLAVAVPPDAVAAVEGALAGRFDNSLRVTGDAALTDLSARISGPDGGLQLDLDEVLARISDGLRALQDPDARPDTSEEQRHG